MIQDQTELLRPSGAACRYGLSVRTLSRRSKEDPAFPKPIRVSRSVLYYSKPELDSYFFGQRQQAVLKEKAHA